MNLNTRNLREPAIVMGLLVVTCGIGLLVKHHLDAKDAPDTAAGADASTAPSMATGQDAVNPHLHREGDKIWIGGVPRLAWGKSGETTFCGALAAALASRGGDAADLKAADIPTALSIPPRISGPDYDYVTLMGTSALAFRVRWYQGPAPMRWSGVTAVGEQSEECERVGRATGLRLEVRWADADDNSKKPQALTDIKASIEAGYPVLTYVSPNMDVAAIYGYQNPGSSFLVQDYWIGDGANLRPGTDVGGLFIFLHPAGPAPAPKVSAVAALTAAVHNWAREDHPKFDEDGIFHYGTHAYNMWMDDLSHASTFAESDRQKLFKTTWWNFDVLNDGRNCAFRYLEATADLFDINAAGHLRSAARIYRDEVALTWPVFGDKTIFLGPWSKKTIADWTPEVRTKEIEMLKKMQAMDAAAIKEIQMATVSR